MQHKEIFCYTYSLQIFGNNTILLFHILINENQKILTQRITVPVFFHSQWNIFRHILELAQRTVQVSLITLAQELKLILPARGGRREPCVPSSRWRRSIRGHNQCGH